MDPAYIFVSLQTKEGLIKNAIMELTVSILPCKLMAYTIWSNLTSYVSFCSYYQWGEKDLCGWLHLYRFLCSKIRTESNGQSKYWADTVKH